MILKNIIWTTVMIAALIIVAGCSKPALYRNWGAAYETAKYKQTLDVNAGQGIAPVEGMNGQAAQKAFIVYKNGFTEASTSSGSSSDLNISGVSR